MNTLLQEGVLDPTAASLTALAEAAAVLPGGGAGTGTGESSGVPAGKPIAGAEGGGGEEVDTGEDDMPQGSFTSDTDAGATMNELWSGIQGSLGALPTTQAGWSDYFAADPLTKSIMLDYQQEFAKKQAQSMEDMKRLGVIRAGDTQRALSNLQESDARTRAGIQSDSAARAQANYEKALASGIDLSGLMERRELGIADLTGMYGGDPTLAGLESDRDLIASAIAAAEAGYDPLAKAILGGLQFTPETTQRDLGGGLNLETRYRDMLRESVFPSSTYSGASNLTEDEVREMLKLQEASYRDLMQDDDYEGDYYKDQARLQDLQERYYGLGSGAAGEPGRGRGPLDYMTLTGDQAEWDKWMESIIASGIQGETGYSGNPEVKALLDTLRGLGFNVEAGEQRPFETIARIAGLSSLTP